MRITPWGQLVSRGLQVRGTRAPFGSRRATASRWVMTRAACEFITPWSLQRCTRPEVITDLFAKSSTGEGQPRFRIEHIAVARALDLLLWRRPPADTLAKFAPRPGRRFSFHVVMCVHGPADVWWPGNSALGL